MGAAGLAIIGKIVKSLTGTWIQFRNIEGAKEDNNDSRSISIQKVLR